MGVPLTLYGKEKKEFRNYLRANDKVSFFYEGVRYVVHFGKVRVFAQCHASIANRMEGMGRLTAVDCGSWTLDIMSVVNKVPVLDECHTYQQGLITAIDRIQKECISMEGVNMLDVPVLRTKYVKRELIHIYKLLLALNIHLLNEQNQKQFVDVVMLLISIKDKFLVFVYLGTTKMVRYALF